MTTATRVTRTAGELDGWRAQAASELAEWGLRSTYVTTTRQAAVDVFDWLTGTSGVAPATGREVAADDATVGEELRRSETLEQQARDGVVDVDPVRYGRIGLVLAWHLHDPDVESPL